MSEKWFIEGENGMEIALSFPTDKEEYHMNREKENILDLFLEMVNCYYKYTKSIGHLVGLMYHANAYFRCIHFR